MKERALQTVNGTVGKLWIKLYVEKCFLLKQKKKAEKMIRNIILAYQNRISNLTDQQRLR
jgi:endothelin-converting enzyme/putative endopeptidase